MYYTISKMRVCPRCNIKKIKNGYQQCFDCNNKQDTLSEPETTTYIKEPINKAVKNCLWINFFKDSRVGICQCCLREPITMNNFHAGHVIAEKNGGRTALDNLKPTCALCNLSMRTQNMDEFISRFNLHFGL